MSRTLLAHHVFVDLETTGLDPVHDEVIELGALFVHQGEVTRRVQRLFRPSARLPLAIKRITGLTDEALADEAPFSDFLPELEALLGGWTVVAHNASFEQSFLHDTLQRLAAPVLDSCELLHYLYPELDSHSLEAAIRWAKVGDRAAHRALKDCEDTHAVVQHALSRFVDDGRAEDSAELLELLDPDPEAPAEGALIALLRDLHALAQARRPKLDLEPSSAFLPQRPGRARQGPRAEPAPEPRPVSDVEVDALLGDGGALARAGGFLPRPQQLEMGRAVARALNGGGALAVEAGTGTGKSLGYLAPSALFAVRNGQQVAVATHTRTLQDQLVEKDLPRLHQALDGGFSFAVLKGQTNYLCRRRALEATQVEPGMAHEDRAPRAYVRALLRRSPDGDLDRTSYWFKEHFPALLPLLDLLRSESATTLGERCPHYRRCYYHSAVAHAKDADVLVVNQALAFAWPGRYPPLHHLILDEAHEVEDAATTALEVELSSLTLLRLGDRLSGDGRNGLFSAIRRALAGTGAGRAAKALISDLEDRLRLLLSAGAALGEAVAALVQQPGGGDHRGPREQRLTGELFETRAFGPVREALQALKGDVEELAKALRPKVIELLPSLPTRAPVLDKELQGAEESLLELLAAIEPFAAPPAQGTCQLATARERPGRRLDWALRSQPTDVSDFVARAFAADRKTLILTSATLHAGPDHPWVLERLGLLDEQLDRKLELLVEPTPFDLRRQALVVLVSDAPDPQSPEFAEWASGRISGLAQFLGGRVLGLFASTRRLEEVGDRVQRSLEPLGIEVLRQSRGNGRALAARQEQDMGSVLLGTKSFWQGLDIPGLGLSCVFIDKLPLEPQSRPIVSAREERLCAGDGSSFSGFMRYRLPRALIQLRQGVGRLIRSPHDRGVVIIADPGSPAYRQRVLAALAGYRVEVLPWARARLRVFEALGQMGLGDARLREARPPATEGIPGAGGLSAG